MMDTKCSFLNVRLEWKNKNVTGGRVAWSRQKGTRAVAQLFKPCLPAGGRRHKSLGYLLCCGGAKSKNAGLA